MKFFYLANIRVPTEKAHGLQIMQMCEAFANCGADVTLLAARRVNTPELARIGDPWAYYGVARKFGLRRIACLDLFAWLPPRLAPVSAAIQTVTYLCVLMVYLIFHRAEIYYSRDIPTLLLLSLFRPRQSLIYEAHQVSKSRLGVRLQSWCVRRVRLVVPITGKLGAELEARGAACILVAHDGFRAERFADLPDQKTARAQVNLPADAFIVGFAGRLHTMTMSKGIDILIDALAQIPDRAITLCLVGGPAEMVVSLREKWNAYKLPPDRFLYAGQVDPALVPTCLRAFDVCTLPTPWTDHFALYTSPIKLFEYMAAGRAIISSNFPAIQEVVRDGETALLSPAGDPDGLASAVQRLYDDPALRARLGSAAQIASAEYTWTRRAGRILSVFSEGR